MDLSVIWFRRDLRLQDNAALHFALKSGKAVLPLFIFDTDILQHLKADDARVTFIHQRLQELNQELNKLGSSLLVKHGKPIDVWRDILTNYSIQSVFCNRDYEPYAIQRDQDIKRLLQSRKIDFNQYKDHVIFEQDQVIKENGDPYTVYTPYSKRWLQRFHEIEIETFDCQSYQDNFLKNSSNKVPDLADIAFTASSIKRPQLKLDDTLKSYDKTRDFPSLDSTSKLGIDLRFGTISVRSAVSFAEKSNETFLKELIWREFFIQILYHFPQVQKQSFKAKYDRIPWLNDRNDFERWCQGRTGFPMVDAGMRELNATGYMHNRVRMITASFLCKHLLIDWRWGERYFAEKLFDYELASNNGNWQWAAGTGCDAAPYFRVFNPSEQLKKFDPDLKYIRKWIPEFDSLDYPQPMIDHKFARNRALEVYKQALAD
ncbi:MAG: deoxyribodipyrimidine photo-lyase [Calditrichaeota bacterium]|nr:deoxyribodipyrimidine photo-lyase [Calditrichota bacterium]